MDVFPNVYQYRAVEQGFELYLGGCTIAAGLSVLDKDTEISIKSIYATLYRHYGCATVENLPKIKNVGAFLLFLKAEGDIGIFEFRAALKGIGSLYSHENEACRFTCESESLCLSVLRSAIVPQCRDLLVNKLLTHPGYYFTCDAAGRVRKYYALEDI